MTSRTLQEQLLARDLTGRPFNSAQLLQQRCAQLRLSHKRTFHSAHAGGITWLALDNSEQRYLLAGAADATLAVYDTQALDGRSGSSNTSASGGRASLSGAAQQGPSDVPPVCLVGRQHPGAHQYLVSCVSWFPHDTGLFLSGSYDQTVKLWDTNTLEAVNNWHLPDKVSGISLSTLSGACDGLVAVSSLSVSLRLADIRSGAFTHTLVGHRHPVWCVSWSLRDEYQLVSGDEHGQACVWDIRRFGPLQYLNMYQTQRTRGRAGASDRSDSRADTPPLAAAGAVARVASAPCGMQGMDNASAHTAHYPDVTNNNPSSDSNNNHNTNNIISEQDALESAWRVVDAHRARSLQGTGMGTGSVPGPSGKRTRDGGLVALRNLPTSRRGGGGGGGGGGGNGGMGSQGWAQGAQGGSSVGGGSGEGPSRASSIPRTLAVGATAPVRPGRTGDVIGGRAPTAALRSGGIGGLSDAAVRAHQGSVTCVLPTANGLFWLTGGTDSRLRLWDSYDYHRQLAGYSGTHNRALRARQLAATEDGRIVFHPSGSIVQVFNVRTAASLCELSGHTESINACVWNPLLGELYSGANDCRILVWTPDERARSARAAAGDAMEEDEPHDYDHPSGGRDGGRDGGRPPAGPASGGGASGLKGMLSRSGGGGASGGGKGLGASSKGDGKKRT